MRMRSAAATADSAGATQSPVQAAPRLDRGRGCVPALRLMRLPKAATCSRRAASPTGRSKTRRPVPPSPDGCTTKSRDVSLPTA